MGVYVGEAPIVVSWGVKRGRRRGDMLLAARVVPKSLYLTPMRVKMNGDGHDVRAASDVRQYYDVAGFDGPGTPTLMRLQRLNTGHWIFDTFWTALVGNQKLPQGTDHRRVPVPCGRRAARRQLSEFRLAQSAALQQSTACKRALSIFQKVFLALVQQVN